MQKSQLEVDHVPVPLMRTRSGHSRDNKKVSCETLSNVDWYSRRPYEAQLYYHSDGNESERPASEAEVDGDGDAEHDNYSEGKAFAGNSEHQGHGEGLSAQAHHFLACFHSKTAADNPETIATSSSPGRHTKKVERGPRTYPSPITHSGSLLPPSGTSFLPHSGPIKLQVGNHSNTHSSSRVLGSARGSTLIPLNIGGKSSKSSGFGNANEPGSPKVTCLGRVKIKQKYCREMGRLADMAAVPAPAEKSQKSIVDRMMKLKQRMKKAQDEEDKALPRGSETQKGAVADVSVRSKDVKRADKDSTLSSAGAQKDRQKLQDQGSWGSHAEEVFRDHTVSDSASKAKRGKWKLKGSGTRTKHLSSEKKKCYAPDVSNGQGFQSDVHSAGIDLNHFRFGLDQLHMQDDGLSESMMSMSIGDGPQEAGERDQRQFEPQVPPSNSLLLMRNSRSRGACATLATSSLLEPYENGASVSDRVHLSGSDDESLKQESLSPRGLDMDEGEQSYLRQASFPSTPPVAAHIWERRRMLKPAALQV